MNKNNKINIAIDAMGGDNAPHKIIEGIKISLKSSNENFFFLYGNENILQKEISKNNLLQENCEIINTIDVIKDDESPLTAVKKGKNSSMWKAIESQKEKKNTYIIICRKYWSTISNVSTYFKYYRWH